MQEMREAYLVEGTDVVKLYTEFIGRDSLSKQPALKVIFSNHVLQ